MICQTPLYIPSLKVTQTLRHDSVWKVKVFLFSKCYDVPMLDCSKWCLPFLFYLFIFPSPSSKMAGSYKHYGLRNTESQWIHYLKSLIYITFFVAIYPLHVFLYYYYYLFFFFLNRIKLVKIQLIIVIVWIRL